jgi:hypothetical protein
MQAIAARKPFDIAHLNIIRQDYGPKTDFDKVRFLYYFSAA